MQDIPEQDSLDLIEYRDMLGSAAQKWLGMPEKFRNTFGQIWIDWADREWKNKHLINWSANMPHLTARTWR